MATTAQVVERVADRHVKRLTGPLVEALSRGRTRMNESALATAMSVGRSRALDVALRAIEDGDLRVLAARRPMAERLLDVAQESADATRCAVRPTTSPAEQAARSRTGADAAAQVVAEASEQAARGMVGADTVRITPEIQRALDTTPLLKPEVAAGGVPNERAVRRALEEAAKVANFSGTGARVKVVNIADLLPMEELPATSELVVRYRSMLPVDPVVINADGVILDGHHRAASAWASGRNRIQAVQVRGNSDVGRPRDWLRWENK